MPKNILNEMKNTAEEDTEEESFDIDDFTQFLEDAQQREIQFDKYVPRSNITEEGNQVLIDGNLYPVFYRGIVNDLQRGDAPIVCIHGKRRSGKTVAAARILHDLHDNIGVLAGEFKPSKQITYKVSEFMNLHFNWIRESCVMEEAGKNLNSKDWYTTFNRANDEVLELLGVMEHLDMYISTHHSDIDSGVGKRDHYRISCEDRKKHKFKVEKYEYKSETDSKELKEDYPKELGTFVAEVPPEKVMKPWRKKELEFKRDATKERMEEVIEEEEGQDDVWV